MSQEGVLLFELREPRSEKNFLGPGVERAATNHFYRIRSLRSCGSENQEKKSSFGKVWFVGAGPGDPDLLTVKAHRLLMQAKVIASDELISKELCALVPKDALLLHVGQRYPQKEGGVSKEIKTSNLSFDREPRLYELLSKGESIVRLKSGDPGVFGRLHEEIDFLLKHEIPFELIPGITAASGAAANFGLALTDQQFASSVEMVTGQRRRSSNSSPEACHDSKRYESSHKTVVHYMSFGGMKELAKKQLSMGVSPRTPVLLVSKASWPSELAYFSTLNACAEEELPCGLESPFLLFQGGSLWRYELRTV